VNNALEGDNAMAMKERSEERRKRIVMHRAKDFDDAEKWDLEFWQRQTPEERLSALVAIRRDVAMVEKAKARLKRRRRDEDLP
jgi:hypothetical protein